MMVNTLTDEELMVLDEFRAEREDDLMDTQDANKLSAQIQDELFQQALQIMLLPAAHSLQLLVSDATLER